jgi:hypothetical protein
MSGQVTTFTLNGLPLGNVTFTESAFSVACASVTSASVATWQSAPTPATLQAGVAANVTVVLRRNGTANVSSDFQDDTTGTCMPGQQSCTVSGMTQCIDVTSDKLNCGACGNVCAPVANAASICTSSTCTFICNVSFRDCNLNQLDGCETNIFTDANNCGGCGLVCSPGTSCQMGSCTAPARIVVSPTSVVFSGIPIGGMSAPFTLQISNTGGAPLQLLSEMTIGPNPSDFLILSAPPPSLAPGATGSMTIAFQPAALGMRSATLQIRSSDPAQPVASVSLSGSN